MELPCTAINPPGGWPRSRDISKPQMGAPGPSHSGTGDATDTTRNPFTMLPVSPLKSALLLEFCALPPG